jgi:enoyl-CoA hydratase
MSAVICEARDNVYIITLNRPEARNAVNQAMAQEVAAALDHLDADPSLRVGIIHGAGGTFCSGMDLKAFLVGESPAIPGRGLAGLTRKPPVKPLIAAVEGYALAGGFEVALACDLVVAHRDAKFGLPEVKRGLVAAAGGVLQLPRQIPRRLAMEFALTGDFVSATRAYEVGLINMVVDGPVLEAALGFARRIAANGPLAVAASKQVILQQSDWSIAEQWDRQSLITAPVQASNDAREGALAFAEKRAPQWTGS